MPIVSMEDRIQVKNGTFTPATEWNDYMLHIMDKYSDKFQDLIGLNLGVMFVDQLSSSRKGVNSFFFIEVSTDVFFALDKIDAIILLNKQHEEKIKAVREPLFFHILSKIKISYDKKTGMPAQNAVNRIKIGLRPDKDDIFLWNEEVELFGTWFDELDSLSATIQKKKASSQVESGDV